MGSILNMFLVALVFAQGLSMAYAAPQFITAPPPRIPGSIHLGSLDLPPFIPLPVIPLPPPPRIPGSIHLGSLDLPPFIPLPVIPLPPPPRIPGSIHLGSLDLPWTHKVTPTKHPAPQPQPQPKPQPKPQPHPQPSGGGGGGSSSGGSGFCAGKAGGLYPDPTDKNAYYNCAQGHAYKENCPAGLVFDTSCSCCSWA